MIYFLLIILFFTIISVLLKFKLKTIYIVYVSMCLLVIGNFMISKDKVWIYNLIDSAIYFIAYYIFNKFTIKNTKKKNNYASNENLLDRNNSEINVAFIFLVILLMIYHFVVGGIPILNDNVEIDRFNFTSSGLFGIPGRMVQYGIYFILFYSYYYYDYENKNKKYFLICLITFILSKLVMGFKGGLYDILVMIIMILSFKKEDIYLKRVFNIKFFCLIIATFMFAAFISSKYVYTTNENTFDYLIRRITVIQTQPGNYMINNMKHKNYWINDCKYYLRKYFKIPLKGIDGYYTLEKYVSASLNNTKLTSNSYIVPVTVGAFNEIWFNTNPIIGFILMFILGALHGNIEKKMKKSHSAFRFSVYGVLIYMLILYFPKGGLLYYLVNYVLVIVLLYAFYITTCLFVNLKKRSKNERLNNNYNTII